MSEHVWTENTRPDRPGIWKRKNMRLYEVHPEDLSSRWAVGTWAFICDLPTIVDPPRYRPVTAADVGKMVEVCHREEFDDERTVGKLIHIRRDGDFRFVVDEGENFLMCPAFPFARILDSGDDGQAKRAREWWLHIGRTAGNGSLVTLFECPQSLVDASCVEVHVREVVD